MVILEKPYISDLTLEYLSNNNVPVLDNDFARESAKVVVVFKAAILTSLLSAVLFETASTSLLQNFLFFLLGTIVTESDLATFVVVLTT